MVTKEPAVPSVEMQHIDAIYNELENVKAQQAQGYQAPTQFQSPQKQNLVEWQLDFRPELEDIEHLLRNDILRKDNRGNEWWERNPDPSVIIFNERGVNEVLKEIRMFLNKNTVLSNYGREEIPPRVRMFAHELRALIYNNYEEYGLDTDYKLNHYPMICITIFGMVESAYRRALNGEERRGLNETRMVNQTDSMGNQQAAMMQAMQQSQKSLFRPSTWFK